MQMNPINNPSIVPSLVESIHDNSNHHQTTLANHSDANNRINNETISNIAKHLIGNASTASILEANTSSLLSDGSLGIVTNHQQNQSQAGLLSLNSTHMDNNSSTSSLGGEEVWYGMPKMDNFVDVFSLCCSTAVIFGGLIPYIPQYLKIKHSMSSDGFSTYVCLTLLLANILRIAFWFGHHFELPLLIQSFVMIAGMLAMMEICVRVRDKHSTFIISSIDFRPTTATTSRRRSLIGASQFISQSASLPPAHVSTQQQLSAPAATYHNQHISATTTTSPNGQSALDSDSYSSQSFDSNELSSIVMSPDQRHPALVDAGRSASAGRPNNNWSLCKWLDIHNFWDWNDFASYLKFLLLFSVLLSGVTILFLENSYFIETLGFVAVFTESMLGMPQLLRNYAKKSTRGMSVEMVVMWLSGDLFKTLYFILRHAPAQFVACGAIQVTVDILILIQVFWFRRPNVTYRKLPKST